MSYTMRGYMSEVMQRLDRFRVASRIDQGMLETLINKSRHDVQMATLQSMPERYARIHVPTAIPAASVEESARAYRYDPLTAILTPYINQVAVLSMPEDFIDAVVVSYTDEDDAVWPARRVQKRELYTTLTKAFTQPTPSNPIYSIEKLNGSSSFRLLISIGENLPAQNSIEVWYLAKLPYMEAAGVDDTEVRLGYDLQELVIMVTVMRVLSLLGMPQAATTASDHVALLVQAVQRQYEASMDRSSLLLQARETTVPNQFAAERA